MGSQSNTSMGGMYKGKGIFIGAFRDQKHSVLLLFFDGKTIRSTGKMEKYEKPMHIVSAQIAELGITFGQQTVYDKSNEIPAVCELIKILKIEGFMVVADALNCQKEIAQAIVDGKADYLLDVKDNHQNLNIVRKIAINSIKRHKEAFGIKSPISKIMFGCLLDCENLLSLFELSKN